jgi:hypothetical protein
VTKAEVHERFLAIKARALAREVSDFELVKALPETHDDRWVSRHNRNNDLFVDTE